MEASLDQQQGYPIPVRRQPSQNPARGGHNGRSSGPYCDRGVYRSSGGSHRVRVPWTRSCAGGHGCGRPPMRPSYGRPPTLRSDCSGERHVRAREMTHGLPGCRGREVSTCLAVVDSGTARAPVLASRKRISSCSRSTSSHRSVRISLRRQPVNISRRSPAAAVVEILPSLSSPSSTVPSRRELSLRTGSARSFASGTS